VRPAPMKSLLVAAAATLALGLIIASPALARAFPETFTIEVDEVFADVNPCTGVPGTITLNYRSLIHVTEGPDIPFHFSLHNTGTLSFVPDDPAGIAYTGNFTEHDSFNTTGPASMETETERFTVNVTGSDGSSLDLRVAAHHTYNANHELTVSFERVTCA
jgi:hypothetical protein